MSRPARSRLPWQLVVTCEHASAAIPKSLGDLGLPARVLRSHRAFDVGALPIAQSLAKALRAPWFVGRWSRLVADLNRSDAHPRVIAARVDGRLVPGNQLDAAALAQRLARYWRPWREQVERRITALVARGPVLHVAVHSFVERLGGVERKNDIGLLCDPARRREVAFCRQLQQSLAASGLRVRRNFPYFGDTDGFTTHLRQRLPVARYVGIEIECNQRRVRTAAGQHAVAAALHALGHLAE